MSPVDYVFKVVTGVGAILEKQLNALTKEFVQVEICSHVKDGSNNIVICKCSNVEYEEIIEE